MKYKIYTFLVCLVLCGVLSHGQTKADNDHQVETVVLLYTMESDFSVMEKVLGLGLPNPVAIKFDAAIDAVQKDDPKATLESLVELNKELHLVPVVFEKETPLIRALTDTVVDLYQFEDTGTPTLPRIETDYQTRINAAIKQILGDSPDTKESIFPGNGAT